MATQPSITLASWNDYLPGVEFSSDDFYTSIEEIITSKEIPNLKFSRVILAQGGMLSAGREYLRIKQQEYIFDICAASYAKGFFVSWWLGENDSPIRKFLLTNLPYLRIFLAKRRKTYYQMDTENMLREAIRASLTEAVNAITPTKALRGLSGFERRCGRATSSIILQPIVSKEFNPQATIETLKESKELSEHRYLQTLIKRMAESRGYVASIEQPTPDGKGRVDVALERNGKKIAVEVCVTTPKEWEMQNIRKCIAAGYDVIVECSKDKQVLENLRVKVQEEFDGSLLDKILLFEPEALFSYLDAEVAKDASTETRMKGYRVKVSYNPLSEKEASQKREQITKVVAESIQKRT
jgi:hypothetical protein